MKTNEFPVQILLAEDNEDDVMLMKEALSQSKILNLMQVVRDGEEALAFLRREGKYEKANLPGLILLDINMPKKNGFDVLEEIKADSCLRQIPVAILTASGSETDVFKSYSRGACSFIQKPVDFEKFFEMIQNFELYWTLVSRIPETRE